MCSKQLAGYNAGLDAGRSRVLVVSGYGVRIHVERGQLVVEDGIAEDRRRVTWWDNSRARHIGYRPQDSADVFRDTVYAQTAAPDLNDPVAIFQGGGFVKAGPFGL